MELSERDVYKLAIRLADSDDKRKLEKLINEAVQLDQVLQDRIVNVLLLESDAELPPESEKIQIIDASIKAREKLNMFCENIIRKSLKDKTVNDKKKNSEENKNSGFEIGDDRVREKDIDDLIDL